MFHKQIYFPIIADHERNDASSDSGKNIDVTAAALC